MERKKKVQSVGFQLIFHNMNCHGGIWNCAKKKNSSKTYPTIEQSKLYSQFNNSFGNLQHEHGRDRIMMENNMNPCPKIHKQRSISWYRSWVESACLQHRIYDTFCGCFCFFSYVFSLFFFNLIAWVAFAHSHSEWGNNNRVLSEISFGKYEGRRFSDNFVLIVERLNPTARQITFVIPSDRIGLGWFFLHVAFNLNSSVAFLVGLVLFSILLPLLLLFQVVFR